MHETTNKDIYYEVNVKTLEKQVNSLKEICEIFSIKTNGIEKEIEDNEKKVQDFIGGKKCKELQAKLNLVNKNLKEYDKIHNKLIGFPGEIRNLEKDIKTSDDKELIKQKKNEIEKK